MDQVKSAKFFTIIDHAFSAGEPFDQNDVHRTHSFPQKIPRDGILHPCPSTLLLRVKKLRPHLRKHFDVRSLQHLETLQEVLLHRLELGKINEFVSLDPF